MAGAGRYDLLFSSDRFNLSQPREYFINECCYGDDVARWLAAQLRERGYRVAEPDQEDWGWYVDVREAESTGSQASYFVGIGGNADDDGASDQGEWRLMVEKHRTLWERITDANLLHADDALLTTLREIIAGAEGLVLAGVE